MSDQLFREFLFSEAESWAWKLLCEDEVLAPARDLQSTIQELETLLPMEKVSELFRAYLKSEMDSFLIPETLPTLYKLAPSESKIALNPLRGRVPMLIQTSRRSLQDLKKTIASAVGIPKRGVSVSNLLPRVREAIQSWVRRPDDVAEWSKALVSDSPMSTLPANLAQKAILTARAVLGLGLLEKMKDHLQMELSSHRPRAEQTEEEPKSPSDIEKGFALLVRKYGPNSTKPSPIVPLILQVSDSLDAPVLKDLYKTLADVTEGDKSIGEKIGLARVALLDFLERHGVKTNISKVGQISPRSEDQFGRDLRRFVLGISDEELRPHIGK